MSPISPAFDTGKFVLGVNYWASHAGTAMWSDWRADVVDEDLRKLAEAGMEMIRVFPLWPDFQPISLIRRHHKAPPEVFHGEQRLGDDEAGRAGMSETAMGRFCEFIDLADRHNLKLLVPLLNGWMSGRLFVPPALDGLNIINDPTAIYWQVRFVKYFVKRFAACPTIVAWGYGNECNCMSPATRDQAWLWASALTDAIRTIDPVRPIFSSMHSIRANPAETWTIFDQAEHTDMLTTHPYPKYTAFCNLDPVDSFRGTLHATAESRFYGDVGNTPCMAEEFNILGPMFAGEAATADHTRACLFSLWAHDCRGLLWWCPQDLLDVEHPPYDWTALERELGLFGRDGTPKPVLGELTRFKQFLDELPFAALPLRQTQGVCLLSDSQDHWGVAYASFMLALQAGFDIEFQYSDSPLKDSAFYLLPSVKGPYVMKLHRWKELLRRVREGATLYISFDDGAMSSFHDITGLEILTRETRAKPVEITLDGIEGEPTLSFNAPNRFTFNADRAKVLGSEADGNPAFTVTQYGKGTIYFLSVPLEMEFVATPGIVDGPQAKPFWQVYKHIAKPFVSDRAVVKSSPLVAVTEHPLDERTRVIVTINQSAGDVDSEFTLTAGWEIASRIHGPEARSAGGKHSCALPHNDAAVFTIAKRS